MSGVAHALRPPGRYWIHIVWLALSLLTCLVAFWSFWPYREVEWNIFRFMNCLAVPALLYSFAALLVPPDPSAVVSWRDHFFDIRARFFGTGAVMMVMVILSNQFTLGVPPLHLSQLGNYLFLLIYLTAAASKSPKIHGFLAIVCALVGIGFLTTIMADPDSLFRTVW